jgi:hypothetical protein
MRAYAEGESHARRSRGRLLALRGPLGHLGDCRSAAAGRLLNGRPRHAGAKHTRDAGVARGIFRPTAIGAGRLGLSDPLRLAAASIVIVLASDRREHVKHHGVESCEHAGREIIARSRKLPACRQIERDDSYLPGVLLGTQLAPVRVCQARQAVDLLDEQYVAGLGVGQQPEKLGAGQLGAAFVLDIRSNDVEATLGRERLNLLAGALGVLLLARGSKVGSGVHGGNHSVRFEWFPLSVCFRLSSGI